MGNILRLLGFLCIMGSMIAMIVFCILGKIPLKGTGFFALYILPFRYFWAIFGIGVILIDIAER